MKHFKDIEKGRKEFQTKSIQKQEKLKENLRKNRDILKETKQSLIEKTHDKFQKVEISKIEREENYYQKAELVREKAKRINENNLHSILENVH